MKYTFKDFQRQFPDEDACLEIVFKMRCGHLKACPKCEQEVTFRRISTRRAYQCPRCYHQIHPCAGSLFHRSKAPLQSWFYAMYLLSTKKNGESTMSIARAIGLGYVATHKMCHKIRRLMAANLLYERPLEGHIEIDESLQGGKERFKHRNKRIPNAQGMSLKGKQPIFALIERNDIGGNLVKAFHLADLKRETVLSVIREHVLEPSIISTDEARIYRGLRRIHKHGRVNHSKGQYKRGQFCTNGAEGFFSQFKRCMRTYVSTSKKFLQNYVDEVSYRFNLRRAGGHAFTGLVWSITWYNPIATVP